MASSGERKNIYFASDFHFGIPDHAKRVEDAHIAKSLEYLSRAFDGKEGFVQPDGGIYNSESVYKNYETQ